MVSHIRTVLLGTALLFSTHNLTAVAHTAPPSSSEVKIAPERLVSARVGIVSGASLRAIAIGY